MFSVGLLLQILGCALYNNWWPMLTVMMYVLAPMPCLFFGGGSQSDYVSVGFGGEDETGWLNAAKFLTGFSAVGSVAIPAILRHATIITTGALLFELSSAGVLALTVLFYNTYNSEEDW
eukprot:jgi/Chlat1/2962/Chrsp2S08912